MGVGMQIVYLGFAGSVPLEAEAGVQLVRIARFGAVLSGCHLTIEALGGPGAGRLYDARLDLITRLKGLRAIGRCIDSDPHAAVRLAFTLAERTLAEEHAARSA
jgi:hypothetical protein